VFELHLKLLERWSRRSDIVQEVANHTRSSSDLRHIHTCSHVHMPTIYQSCCISWDLSAKGSSHLIELHLQLLERGPRRPEIVQNLAHDVKVCLFWLLRPLNRLIVQVCKGLMTVLLPSLLPHFLLLKLQTQEYLLRAVFRDGIRSLAPYIQSVTC